MEWRAIYVPVLCYGILLTIISLTSAVLTIPSTLTAFTTGPFAVSFNMGNPCQVNIETPENKETLSGKNCIIYCANIGIGLLTLTRFDEDTFDIATPYGTEHTRSELLSLGCIPETITVVDREIDGRTGAVGEGYLPEKKEMFYLANYIVSPRTKIGIGILGNDNYNKVINILNTINIDEI